MGDFITELSRSISLSLSLFRSVSSTVTLQLMKIKCMEERRGWLKCPFYSNFRPGGSAPPGAGWAVAPPPPIPPGTATTAPLFALLITRWTQRLQVHLPNTVPSLPLTVATAAAADSHLENYVLVPPSSLLPRFHSPWYPPVDLWVNSRFPDAGTKEEDRLFSGAALHGNWKRTGGRVRTRPHPALMSRGYTLLERRKEIKESREGCAGVWGGIAQP